MSTQDKTAPDNRQAADFLAQSQERAALRYREQFRQEQMAIYKEQLKKEAEEKAAEENEKK